MSLRRQPVREPERSRTESKSFPAPVLGWVSAQNLAANKPLTAARMDSWFPTTTGIRLFGGSLKWATIGSAPVESMMAYAGDARELFACDETNIFDITNPADPDIAPAADVTGQTSGYYTAINFATAAGKFMYALNGTDNPQLYDGSTWAEITNVSVPKIAGTTDTSKLSTGTVYRERIYMVERDSLNVWAMDAGALGTAVAAIQISLAGVFKKGGSVLLVGTWSLDSGAGLDDKFVIISTDGEVAVYQGSDPSDPTDWSIVGLYEIPPPLGKNATMRAGGDLIILTKQGAIPISEAVQKDPAALSLAAISRQIQPDWVRDAGARGALPWEIAKWPTKSMAIVTNPLAEDEEDILDAQVYAVNLESGAWCRRPGWAARCVAHHVEQVYFGTNDGTVMQADTTGEDDGMPYTASVVLGWDHLKAQGYNKTISAYRAQFVAAGAFDPQISASVDYVVDLPPAPNAASEDDDSLWDTGLWDQAKWDGGDVAFPVSTRWVSGGQSGSVHAPQLQVTSGSAVTPEIELTQIDVLFERGEIML